MTRPVCWYAHTITPWISALCVEWREMNRQPFFGSTFSSPTTAMTNARPCVTPSHWSYFRTRGSSRRCSSRSRSTVESTTTRRSLDRAGRPDEWALSTAALLAARLGRQWPCRFSSSDLSSPSLDTSLESIERFRCGTREHLR